MVALAAVAMGGLALAGPSPCDTESAYYCIAVEVDPGDPDGRVLVLDRLSHAYVDLADPTNLKFGYERRFSDAVGPYLDGLGRPVDVLHVGGGGFTFPRYLEATRPVASQTVLELDPRVLAVAQEQLGFAPSDAIRVVVGDARLSIERLPDDSVDLVVGDAFGGLAVPWHLTTTEFLEEIGRVLRPGGMYVMNLIDYPPLGFVRAEAATASRLFEHVAVISGRATLANEAGGNVVLVASAEPLDVAAVTGRASRPGARTRRPGSWPIRPRWPSSSGMPRSSATTSRRWTSSWAADPAQRRLGDRSRRTGSFWPRIVALRSACSIESARLPWTSTSAKSSNSWIAPTTDPGTPASLAMAPTRSPGRRPARRPPPIQSCSQPSDSGPRGAREPASRNPPGPPGPPRGGPPLVGRDRAGRHPVARHRGTPAPGPAADRPDRSGHVPARVRAAGATPGRARPRPRRGSRRPRSG